MIYIIPARKGSKGFPHKNRYLFKFTAELVKDKTVIVTSDDDFIRKQAEKYNFIFHKRNKKLSSDTADINGVMADVIKRHKINDDVCMLYLTYPKRKKKHIEIITAYYKKIKAKSLLCLTPCLTHPYLAMENKIEKWRLFIQHDLYRRQDYPEAMKLSHYVAIFHSSEISKLNKQLFNNDTKYYIIGDVLDVDKKTDCIR